MVTAAQLQILQSPITHLISTVSTSVNVKLDDSNYLNWNFQIQLLLESNGIFGFVDGSQPCLSPSTAASGECGSGDPNSSSVIDCDAMMIWKMHDRVVMQLITTTLSPIALSCAIGSNSSRELWMRLKEQFSTVSKTSIFQLKSNLQNIRKGSDNISQYLLKIKEARDYLMAAGVHFADKDIVILALNGLPSECNTFRCVVRGRESLIPLKEFWSQLLAEERIVENIVPENSSYLTAMHTMLLEPSQTLRFPRFPPHNLQVSGDHDVFNSNCYGSMLFEPTSSSWIQCIPNQGKVDQTSVIPHIDNMQQENLVPRNIGKSTRSQMENLQVHVLQNQTARTNASNPGPDISLQSQNKGLNTQQVKTVGSNDPFWNYVEWMANGSKKCSFCPHTYPIKTSISRIKWHLSGEERCGVAICHGVTKEVQEEALKAMRGSNKRHKSTTSSINVNDHGISTCPQEQNIANENMEGDIGRVLREVQVVEARVEDERISSHAVAGNDVVSITGMRAQEPVDRALEQSTAVFGN